MITGPYSLCSHAVARAHITVTVLAYCSDIDGLMLHFKSSFLYPQKTKFYKHRSHCVDGSFRCHFLPIIREPLDGILQGACIPRGDVHVQKTSCLNDSLQSNGPFPYFLKSYIATFLAGQFLLNYLMEFNEILQGACIPRGDVHIQKISRLSTFLQSYCPFTYSIVFKS